MDVGKLSQNLSWGNPEFLSLVISSPPTILQHQTSCVLFELDHTFNKHLSKVIKAKLTIFYVLSVQVYIVLQTSDFSQLTFKVMAF